MVGSGAVTRFTNDPEQQPTPGGPRRWLAARRAALPDGADGVAFVPAVIEITGTHLGRVEPVVGDYDEAVSALRRGGAEVEDLGDHILTPAFVNPHTHCVLSFLRAADVPPTRGAGNLVEELYFRVESRLDPGDVRAFARMGAYESLLGGVGLVWDHYYEGLEVAAALDEVGLAGVVAPTLQDLSGPGARQAEAQLAATEALTDPAWARRGIYAAVGPHATDTVSDALWDRASDLAARHDLPLHAHCAQSIEELERAHDRWGVGPMAGLARLGVLARAPRVVLAHALFATRAELGGLDPRRHAVISCPSAQLIFGFPADVSAFEEAGATWAVATDCAASNDSMNLQKELRTIAGFRTVATQSSDVYQRFLASGDRSLARATWEERADRYEARGALGRPDALLARLWSIPGRFHPAARAGVLAEGALASAVAWDPHHPSMWPAGDPARVLAFGDTTQAIHAMWVCGRSIGARGAFHEGIAGSEDYRAARREASDRLGHLLRRCGWPAP